MLVIKNNGKKEQFKANKIKKALKRTYKAINKDLTNFDVIYGQILEELKPFKENDYITTKQIDDIIENVLLNNNEIELVKQYIKYRLLKHKEDLEEKKTFNNINVIKRNGNIEAFDISKIKRIFKRVSNDIDLGDKPWLEFKNEFKKYIINNIETKEIMKLLIKTAVDKININNTNWQLVAGRLLILDLYSKASKNLNCNINKLYSKEVLLKLVNDYIKVGYYFKDFKRFYKDEDFLKAFDFIDLEQDFQYGYTTALMYSKRYLLNPNGIVKELPQMMYLMISLFLAIPEGLDTIDLNKEKFNYLTVEERQIIKNPNKTLEDILKLPTKFLLDEELIKARLEFAKKVYEKTSKGEISLPTPTLLNARTNKHQLSSCFKLNIDDSLRGIYHGIENMAQISKYGGGIGTYLGHIRAKGGSIRGIKGASGGVLPWVKVINDTAIAVNQLGARAGAISVTIDMWHLDILDFLEMQTETGDIRRKSFDVFPAVSIPDLFMKRVLNNENWTLFDPKELRDKLGVRLEDYYGDEFEKLYLEAEKRKDIELKQVVNAKDLFKQFLRTVVETGMPYVFFRDTSNKYNPNKHAGMVYSTQLCTEIIQNTKESKFVEEKTEDGLVIIKYKPGDTVVCNLASINVAKVNPLKNNVEETHRIALRILDNVITLNFYPVEEAKLTAMKYRAVGLGYMGLAEYLATQAELRYDSEEAVKHVDELFEKYAYYTMKASVELAKERGKYKLFEGSEYSKGILFGKTIKSIANESKNLKNEWLNLENEIKKYGVRFGYHQAPAPNTSTALVVGTTAGLLPVYKKYFVETNGTAPIVNVAPNLSNRNFWLYKEYVHMDMKNVIKIISTIQKWIDQSISFEWLINPMEISPKDLFMYYVDGWKQGLKTIYYVRSMSMEVEKCESCAG